MIDLVGAEVLPVLRRETDDAGEQASAAAESTGSGAEGPVAR
jgi:hypothetical protein